jgi:hypothetical protein
MKTSTICVATLLTSSIAAGQDQPVFPIDLSQGNHIQEFVISVSDMKRTLPTFTDVMKWKIFDQGKADASVARLWGLDTETPVDQVLVGNAESKYGFIRLVEIKIDKKEIIRPGGRWWDTGGIFNFNVFFRDLDSTAVDLRKYGWNANNLPATYERPNNVRGKTMMMLGPDDVMMSFQQRISRPMTGWPDFQGASHIEVGYQIVTDIKAWSDFYTNVLGFGALGGIRELKDDKPVGPNVYGLPHNAVGFTDGFQVNVKFRDKHEQSLGARQFTNATGYDFTSRANPPNLGIMTVRVPVSDVKALRERIVSAKIDMPSDLQIVRLAPYGAVRALAVRSPGSGMWLELFQPGAEPMTEGELKDFTRQGRYATWTRFNNKLTGSVLWRKDGSARVKWDEGGLDEEGTWAIKGNAVCTAWKKLRNNRELCVHHYRLAGDTTQSFTVDGRTDGIYNWKSAGVLK